MSHLFRNAGGGSDGYNYPRPAQHFDDFTNNNFIQQIPQQQPQIIPIQKQPGFIQQQQNFQDKPFVTPIQNNYVQQQKPDYLPPCSNGGIGSNCQIPQPPPRPYVPPVRDEYHPPQPQPQCQFGGIWPNCYNPTQPQPQPPKYIPPAAPRPCVNGGIGINCQIPQQPSRPYVPPVVRDEYRPIQPQPQPQCQFGGVWPNCYNPPPPPPPPRQQNIHNDYLPPCANGGYGPNCQIPQQPQPQPSHTYDDESGYKYNIPRVQLN